MNPIETTQRAIDFWYGFGIAANIITVVAGMIAIAGVVSVLLSRPRVVLHARGSQPEVLYVSVTNEKGSSPARYVTWEWGGLTSKGDVMRGDGDPLTPQLYPKESWTLVFHQPDHPLGYEPSERMIVRPILDRGEGIMVDLTWQRTVLPWLRTRAVVVWTAKDRDERKDPAVIYGLAADRGYNAAHRKERATTKAAALKARRDGAR